MSSIFKEAQEAHKKDLEEWEAAREQLRKGNSTNVEAYAQRISDLGWVGVDSAARIYRRDGVDPDIASQRAVLLYTEPGAGRFIFHDVPVTAFSRLRKPAHATGRAVTAFLDAITANRRALRQSRRRSS